MFLRHQLLTLLNADAETNSATAASLMQNAIDTLSEGQATVASILNNAITLLKTPGTDVSVVISLLESAETLL